MRRHWLGTLVGLCMLGLAAPTWAVPMSTTLFGEVTEVLDPDLALDLVVGSPMTMTATWGTDDYYDLVQDGFEPGFFLIRMGVSPSASLTVTVGSHTWVATDEFDYGEFLPFLMFDADDDLLGARFFGENSAGEVFGTFVFAFLVNGFPPGLFAASSEMILGPVEGVGVTGEFETPGWDGDFPVLAPVVAEPGTLVLLGLGLLGLGVTRRRAN